MRPPWRLLPIRANAPPAFACYQGYPADRFRLGPINVLRLRAGLIVEIAGFLDPAVHRCFGLPTEPGSALGTEPETLPGRGTSADSPAER